MYIVRTSIEGWKTTPWRKVDVENMDLECKKFAKEIRGKSIIVNQWLLLISSVVIWNDIYMWTYIFSIGQGNAHMGYLHIS